MNTSWPFETDKIETWAYYNNALSKEECNKIISFANKKKLEEATILSKNKEYMKKIRDSHITWLYPCEELHPIYLKIANIMFNLNKSYFNFDLFGFAEGFQFTNYKAPVGKYGKHIDRAINTVIRKLSIVIQLTDPKKYKGGDLCLYIGDKAITIPKEQGKLIAFPYMFYMK
jgi:PKHD-type hydroxylase